MTIVEFLLARIAEDEAEARDAIAERARVSGDDPRSSDPDMSLQSWPDVGVPAVLVGPERVLAECASKRHMLRMAQRVFFPSPLRVKPFWDGQRAYAEAVLEELAAVYADHPDYDTSWRV